nr:PREDICTED: transcription initiation factor TFIID subunit 13 isoform X1 [Megachile rotundata]
MTTEEGFEQFEDEEAEIPIGGTLPGGRKRLFSKELRCMMYGFGDDQNPYTESVDLLEDLVIEFITEMTHRAMEIGRTGRVQVEDIVFLVRKDPRKYARVKDLLTMNEELKKARKAFDEVKYADCCLSFSYATCLLNNACFNLGLFVAYIFKDFGLLAICYIIFLHVYYFIF